MPAQRGHRPSKKAARQEGARVGAKSGGALQPVGKRKAKDKVKSEAQPAVRIVGVGGKAKPIALAAGAVSLRSLSVGNGGTIINLTEKQAASVLKPR
jgi:hypothetical protein